MPYTISRNGEGKYCVYKQGEDGEPSGESLGCHDTQEQAGAQIGAIENNETSAPPEGDLVAEPTPCPDCAPEPVGVGEFLFVDLALLLDGKAFDAMAPVDTQDMHGARVVLSAKDLKAIARNTAKAIEATRTESGEIVGLPIDARAHDKGDAAGWIVGVELAGEVLRVIPRWTELGIELISKKIQQFFSATVDLTAKVMLGGTLTNWPAMRDKTGKVLLRPIELSKSIYHVETGADDPDTTKGVITMDITEERLNEMIAAAVSKALPATPPQPVEQAAELSLSKLFDLEGLTEEAKKQRKAELQAELQALRKQAELEYRAEMARLKHEGDVTEMANKLTGGTDDAPRGLRVAAEELKAHLLKLDPDEARWFGDLLARTTKDGLVEFGENGHGKAVKHARTLPAEVAASLDRGDYTVADLSSPILALGDLSEYDLSKWQK